MPWQRIALVVEGRHAEPLGDALTERGAISTEVTDADAGTEAERAVFGEPGAEAEPWPRARLAALFEEDADPRGAVAAALAECGIEALEPAFVDRVADEDWVALTQRQFWPIRVGERLWVVPTWHTPPEPDAVNVLMDPGAAFGTGWHPTTRLCLAWLEKHVRPGDVVLDYGCGSGILGIGAMKLGAKSAAGVDVDPRALEAARYNASINGVRLEVLEAGAQIAAPATITVANILANPLRVLAPLIASHTRPRGRIALSGILDEQAAEVAAAYAPHVRLEVEARDSGWVLLAGVKD
ncbi:MAG TPA: 50S ribosomal protein L11 methyltransferase [Usitatibacter sp.]|nr:50S ribosomal protein L11 methyltransferase [Usitatibacter sp.]